MTAKLNRLSDEANAMVNAVEDYLQEIGASAVTWKHPTESFELRWDRYGGKHRIIVVKLSPVEFSKPWGDCSRYLRLKMFVGIPILLTEIRAEIEALYRESFEEVSKTMKELEKIMVPIEE